MNGTWPARSQSIPYQETEGRCLLVVVILLLMQPARFSHRLLEIKVLSSCPATMMHFISGLILSRENRNRNLPRLISRGWRVSSRHYHTLYGVLTISIAPSLLASGRRRVV